MKHIFIVNPKAGKKDQRSRIYEMADALRARHSLEVAVMLTDRPGGATDICGILGQEETVRRLKVGLEKLQNA